MELLEQLHWCSDWNGDEVDYPERNVIGLYVFKANINIHCYVDAETMEILDVWEEEEV